MRGIQINNFFNNHISLNGKKINNNHPTNIYQPTRPQPLIINHIPKHDSPEQIIINTAVTPQMKFQFKDGGNISARKNRSNTNAPYDCKIKSSKKSKQKYDNSVQQIKRPLSAGKNYDNEISDEKQFNRNINTKSKKENNIKSKISQDKYISNVRRSKSAIIKNNRQKTTDRIQPNIDISKQFFRQTPLNSNRKNIINSVDNSNTGKKNSSKKLINKETQLLINKKQKVQKQKIQCRTARVQSTIVKGRKTHQKIKDQLKKGQQKIQKEDLDKLYFKLNNNEKFQTQKQKKSARTTISKSYLTTAKQSKPVSARDKQIKKKLFSSKQKEDHILTNQDQTNLALKVKQLINNSTQNLIINKEQSEQQVNSAINQLQYVLQNIQSRKILAKQLKKFTHRIKQITSNTHSQEDDNDSEQIKEIVHFKNFKKLENKTESSKKLIKQKHHNLHGQTQSKREKPRKIPKTKSNKKISQRKDGKTYETITNNKESFKNKKNKHQNLNFKQIQDETKKFSKNKICTPIIHSNEPSPFRNQEQQQSQFVDSRNLEINDLQHDKKQQNLLNQLNEQNYEDLSDQNANYQDIQAYELQNEEQSEALDQNNKKYMEFLRNLQSQHQPLQQNQFNKPLYYQKKNYSQQSQQNDHYIRDINTYLNDQTLRQYDSQKPLQKFFTNEQNKHKIFNNPILERRRLQNLHISNNGPNINVNINQQKDSNNLVYQENKRNLSEKDNTEQQEYLDSQENINERNKIMEIQKLKEWRKQAEKMMGKIGKKLKQENQNGSNKKKNLVILVREQNTELQKEKNQSQEIALNISVPKSPSSPKYYDHYPQLVKSPKLSDVELTKILSLKQQCLVSKHEKMNQLIQKMYQKQLVSPKSYEYSVYHLKKKYQQETDGLDGFKEQASSILKQINKDKDEIKDIDQLIREEKWQEARKLMQVDQRTASIFTGFKKKINKDKIYQEQGWQRVDVYKPQTFQMKQSSPNKRGKISVVPNNINLSILPSINKQSSIKKSQIISTQIQDAIAVNKKQIQVSGKLIRQKPVHVLVSDSQSQSQGLQQDNGHNSIRQKLQFQFEEKYKLKGNEIQKPQDLQKINQKNYYSQDLRKLQQEVSDYLDVEKADSQDFQHYVYYQSQQAEKEQSIQNNSGLSNQINQLTQNKQLKQQGIFKLIQVENSRQSHQSITKQQRSNDSQQNIQNDQLQNLEMRNRNNTIQIIDDSDITTANIKLSVNEFISQKQANQKVSSLEHQVSNEIIEVPNIQSKENIINQFNSQFKVLQNQNELEDNDSQSQTNSILQLSLRKGFQSNLFFIKQYCISLCQYIRDNQSHKSNFKSIISQSLEFNIQNLLKDFRVSLKGDYNNQYNTNQTELQYKNQYRKPEYKAISKQVADQFNKNYGQLKFYNINLEQKGKNKFKMQKETQKIFLEAILEVLNESLDFERPGSIFGKPLPWKNHQKYLKNMKYLKDQKKKKISSNSDESAETFDFIFGVAIARIIQWGSCLCGFLPDTAQLQNTQIDEDYVVHIRQTRMACLLQKLLAQEQATINNSELQQTEIMLYLGKIIAEQVVKQASKEISILNKNRNCFNLQEQF